MAQYSGVSFNTVTVYTDSSYPGTLADIFEDVGETTPMENPFVCFGRFTFYGDANLYIVRGDLTRLLGTTSNIESAGYWSPLTNGDVASPELIFADGDTISIWTPT